jgi:hypothetical protein
MSVDRRPRHPFECLVGIFGGDVFRVSEGHAHGGFGVDVVQVILARAEK